MVKRNVADLEAEKAELDGTWNDKEAQVSFAYTDGLFYLYTRSLLTLVHVQIAELNAALEELEEEKGRDLNALHVQHQEQQRLPFLGFFWGKKVVISTL
jgi:predicted transcriptional regulator